MSSDHSFEFMLLNGMAPAYRSTILRDLGLLAEDAVRAAEQSILSLPRQLNADLSDYMAVLGQPATVGVSAGIRSDLFKGSRAYFFLLELWPHLYWTVNQSPNGSTWGCGFRNQGALKFPTFDPDLIRPGVWTQSALQEIADDMRVVDGWDEVSTVTFDFGHQEYEGEFAFQLLQSWKRRGAGP